MNVSWPRTRHLVLDMLIGLSMAMALFLAPDSWGAESCSGGLGEFDLLQSADEGSGLGGTGIGGSDAIGENPRMRSPASGDENPRMRSPASGDEKPRMRSPASGDEKPQMRSNRSGDENDSGIGGTGRSSRPPGDDDSGIGGTGIYGTVTRTDRLCVGGVEIEIQASLALESSSATSTSDGQRSLATGQVVFVLATRTEDAWVARKIFIDAPYAGQIDEIGPEGKILVVSGRRVRLSEETTRGPGLSGQALEKGAWIRFYGLVDESNTVVVSRVERGEGQETSRLGSETGESTPRWHEEMRDLAYVSLEGFVLRDSDGLSVAGVRIDLDRARRTGVERNLTPGARVRVGGRFGTDDVLRIESPPRSPGPSSHHETRPAVDLDTTSPQSGGAAVSPPSPERTRKETPKPPRNRSGRPDEVEIPRPDRRPDIRPPTPDRIKPSRPIDRVRPSIN